MKHVFLTILGVLSTLLVSPAVIASRWGIADAYVEESADYSSIISSNHEQFALHKVLAGIPIRYAIEFEKYPGQTAQTDQQWAQQVIPIIRQAFYSWPEQTSAFIENSGRKRQFQDILSLLARHTPNLVQTSLQEADIVFYFSNYKGAAFNYNTTDLKKQKKIRLPNPAHFGQQEFDKLPNFLLHEVGHYYGLGDRYQEGIAGNSPTYSSTGDTDSDSIMASSLGSQLTCDDVDGFINLIDLTLFVTCHKYSSRARKGWGSFCSPAKMYVQAKELNRAAFYNGNYIFYYNPDGTVKNKIQARVHALYNPLVEPKATQGPFSGVQQIPSEKYTMDAQLDYTQWPTEGIISIKTTVANLTFLEGKVTRRAPRSWNAVFNYVREANGALNHTQYEFDLQHTPQFCTVSSSKYVTGWERAEATLTAGTGVFSARTKVHDASYVFDIQANGTKEQEQYQITQDATVYNVIFKDGGFFSENEDLIDDPDVSMSLFEGIADMQRYLETARALCRYTASVAVTVR